MSPELLELNGGRNSSPLVMFAKRTGIVAGAAIAVYTLWGIVTRLVMLPIEAEIARQVTEERVARTQADDHIVDALKSFKKGLVMPHNIHVIVRDTVRVAQTHGALGPRLFGR